MGRPTVNLLTVPRTGTRFVAKLMSDMGVIHHHRHFMVGTYLDKWMDPEFPTVITLRDPLLARISQLNFFGRQPDIYPVWLWRQAMRYKHHARVHFVRVDKPRENELELLAEFLGRRPPSSKWEPIGSGEYTDKLGLLKLYEYRHIPDELKGDAWLLNKMGATDFFKGHGYDLPWMDKRYPPLEKVKWRDG